MTRTFKNDERGVAAVEFALLLPVMILLFFGSIEFVSAYNAQNRLAHVAASLADLTAQDRSVNDTQLNDLFNVGVLLMHPYATTGLGERISSLQADASGNVTVAWTSTNGNYTGSTATVPAGYLAANESVIVADVKYDYTSPLRFVLPGTIHFQRHAYYRPRITTAVAKT